ncbi:hypothetical protein DY245_19625 [Streptomyces inhibens]|uniref:Uncharacterized protein n=1 Tax=Streptomyces inhibens TaxID=2293571 RepID=A0A371Q1V5_STRIH|nr:hypothetical protein DY245_19625 [Streptomyces inhibens]
MAFRAEATVHCPDGTPVNLGGWMSYSPGGALGWVRKRAEQVAQQLGAPYDRAVRAWLDDAVEYRWAVDGLAAGIPFVLRAVDAEGCTYAFIARPDVDVRTATAPLRVPCGQGAA